jgi:8-oxo-dGTP diphosphatase
MPLNPVHKHCYEYPRPSVTVDLVVFARNPDWKKHDPSLSVLLIRRGKDPFKDCWALPGGFLDENETTEDAAIRELKEETGHELDPQTYVKLVGVYDTPNRDPRGRVISVAYTAELDRIPEVKGSDDAVEARWFHLKELTDDFKLAFDHHDIIVDAIWEKD